MTNVEYLSFSVINSLNFCYKSLIPSLFPFLVLSSVALYCIRLDSILKYANQVLDKCKIYKKEIIIGWITGFVVGAKGICENFKKNDDIIAFNNAIIISSNAGIGFVIGCVGGVIWNDFNFGIYLYFSQIFSAIILSKLFLKHPQNQIDNTPSVKVSDSFSTGIIKAIKNSTSTILTICFFNIFFNVIKDLICLILKLNETNLSYTIISVIFDFSNGIFSTLKIENLLLKGFLSGACIGFGGICVLMQIFAECEGKPLYKFQFIFFKLIQGILCGFLAVIYILLIF